MGDSKYKSYKIVFNNKAIELTYDMSFPEFKQQTIENLIDEVLENIGPKPLDKEPNDFNLHCSCGKILDQTILLSEPKCNHPCQEENLKEKIKNEKYFLVEKEEEDEDFENNVEKQLSPEEINEILKRALENKPRNAKKGGMEKKPQKKKFTLPEGLKNKIKEYKIKRDRGINISDKNYSIFYNEDYYKELISMGIDKNKVKAALRISNNNKNEAALTSTDENTYWDNREYLFYDNKDVINKEQFEMLCIKEIKKEYPFLQTEEEINQRFKDILELIGKKDKEENSNESDDENNDDSSDE